MFLKFEFFKQFFLSIFTVNDYCVNNSWCSDDFFENILKFDEKFKFAQNFEARISDFGLTNQKSYSTKYLSYDPKALRLCHPTKKLADLPAFLDREYQS